MERYTSNSTLLDRPAEAQPSPTEVTADNRDVKCIFSIDVEDWFHILDLPSTPTVETWGNFPSFVEKNFHQLLDLFDRKNTLVTCLFLGWIAEKYPQLVRTAAERGHEIAAHGYSHYFDGVAVFYYCHVLQKSHAVGDVKSLTFNLVMHRYFFFL